MKFELAAFQQEAQQKLRQRISTAQKIFRELQEPQVISFRAPTGAGKTIMMISLIESIYRGDGINIEQPNAIFIWLSDSPELNRQSMDKFYFNSDIVNGTQLVMIEDESFDAEIFDDGRIYFLNTQKLGKNSNLTKHSEGRRYTIFETLQNTISEKSDRLYFVIDEAHRGMLGNNAAKATTIMQKFIKGSIEDGLNAAPLVIGMSATPERFNALVKGIHYTTYQVVVEAEEVKASGLLKDKIIVLFPDESEKSAVTKDMAILEAAADAWKDKVEHWSQYCREQHEKMFNPIFVVQVQNGKGSKISDTDLDDCLRRISERNGFDFEKGEVVHTFSDTKAELMINNLPVMYEEPSSISGHDHIKVVFFKESLSTGWDCPRAETMMSFRHASDATYIAQLLGRMIRTPLQRHIKVDDTLNEVKLFLPYFDKDNVQSVIDELNRAEGGEIPAEIVGESIGESKHDILTVNVDEKISAAKSQVNNFSAGRKISDESSIFDNATDTKTAAVSDTQHVNDENPGVDESHSVKENLNVDKNLDVDESLGVDENFNDTQNISGSQNSNVPQKIDEAKIAVTAENNLDRRGIVKAINDMGLLSYNVRRVRINDYLKSLFKMAELLSRYNLYRAALKDVTIEAATLIHNYIEQLKSSGEYENLKHQAKEFKLSAQIFDTFGENFRENINQNLFVTTESDIERQFYLAKVHLKNEGIADGYLKTFCGEFDEMSDYKIDVILFAADNTCLDNLEKFAKNRFHRLNDDYRRKIAQSSEQKLKNEYDRIVSDGDVISKHNFTLPETISKIHDSAGKVFSDHLFVDKLSGTAKIKLNGWEEGVLHEEQQRKDFVCWLRNFSRQSWALCIPYEMNNSAHEMYPDFLIVRYDDSSYVADILEPHDPSRQDNIYKAKGLAAYAKENPGVDRIQMIREYQQDGRKFFRRLDFSKGTIREKVLSASTNAELDNIFEECGQIDSQTFHW